MGQGRVLAVATRVQTFKVPAEFPSAYQFSLFSRNALSLGRSRCRI